MKLSIVATLYQSAPYINEFYARVSVAAKELVGEEFELILVNDGSPDNSLDLAIKLTEQDPHVVVVDLSRNFGHHKAMMTGLAHASGELVFLIDSDLEEEPEWLPRFYEQMQRENCDVVFGNQQRRKGNWLERLSGQWFYRLFKALTGIHLSETATTARLMTQSYVKALISHEEREVFLAGLWNITGFNQQPNCVKKHSTSKTTYSLKKKVSLLTNAVTSFSNKPLVFIFNIGLVITLFSLLYAAYNFLQKALYDEVLSGWSSIIISIWLLGGLQISFIGLIGMYLSKVYTETKKRPYTIIKNIYKRGKASDEDNKKRK